MIRDFTDEAKNTLYDQIDSVTPQDGINTVLDCLSDIYMYHPQMLQIIGATKNMNDMKTYHEYMLDRNNTSKEKIDIIFDDVEQVESDYRMKMVSLLNYLSASVNYFDRMASMMGTKGSMLLSMSAEQLRAQTVNRGDMLGQLAYAGINVELDADTRAVVEKRLEELTSSRYNGQSNVSAMTEEEMQALVGLYELLHPMDGKNMTQMLDTGNNNTLTAIDKLRIKYIAYTAAEPYRSVYLAYADDYEIGSFAGSDDGGNAVKGAYYSSNYDELYFENTLKYFSQDPRGPYTTWFHENGHAIDHNAVSKQYVFYCYDFQAYSTHMQEKVTVQEAIFHDVYENIEAKIDDAIKMTNLQVDRDIVMSCFEYGWQNVDLSQYPNEAQIRDEVLYMFSKNGTDPINGPVNEATSDVYGGVTNLAINVGYGHTDVNSDGSTYWYDVNGVAKKSPSKELVAEYFSYYMTDNQPAITSMRNHFPAACEVLDQMFAELGDEVRK